MTHVRRAQEADRDPLLDLWERSVRATHHFLEDRDVVALRPFVAEELASDAVEWWVLESGASLASPNATRQDQDAHIAANCRSTAL